MLSFYALEINTYLLQAMLLIYFSLIDNISKIINQAKDIISVKPKCNKIEA